MALKVNFDEAAKQVTANTVAGLFPLWMDNFAHNLALARTGESLDKLFQRPASGRVLVVGRGPSIFKHGHLDLLAKHPFPGHVVASDGAVPLLAQRKIPFYASMTVDGNQIIAKWFEGLPSGTKLNAILPLTVHPKTAAQVQKAGGHIYWYIPELDQEPMKGVTNTLQLMTYSPSNPTGISRLNACGNCGLAAIAIAMSILRAKEVCLAGYSILLSNPHGPITIETIEAPSHILTPSGYVRVVNKVTPGFRDVIGIRTSSRLVRLTPDHRLLVATRTDDSYCGLTSRGSDEMKKRLKDKGFSYATLSKQVGRSATSVSNWINRRSHHPYTSKETAATLFSCLDFLPSSEDIRMSKYKKNGRIKSRTASLEWRKAADVKIGDLVVIQNGGAGGQDSISADWAWLLGVFCGDGTSRKRPNKRGTSYSYQVSFCIPATEKILRSKLIELLKGLGYSPSLTESTVIVYRKSLFQRLEKYGLTVGSLSRTVPDAIWNLLEEEKIAFISGCWDSDGSIEKNGYGIFVSRSKKMVESLRLLCICCALHVENIRSWRQEGWIFNGVRKYWNEGTNYSFKLQPSSALRLVRSVKVAIRGHKTKRFCNYRFRLKTRGISASLPDNCALDIVREIAPEGQDKVYDIQMETGECFFADGVLTHNCMVGMDSGYPPDTPIENCHYHEGMMKSCGYNAEQVAQLYRMYWHDKLKATIVDPVFEVYRRTALEIAKNCLQSGVKLINATEGGCLFGPGIDIMKFEDYLELKRSS